MLSVYYLEMIIRGRAEEVDGVLRRDGLLRGAMGLIRTEEVVGQGGPPQARFGPKLMGLRAALAGLSSRGQHIEER